MVANSLDLSVQPPHSFPMPRKRKAAEFESEEIVSLAPEPQSSLLPWRCFSCHRLSVTIHDKELCVACSYDPEECQNCYIIDHSDGKIPPAQLPRLKQAKPGPLDDLDLFEKFHDHLSIGDFEAIQARFQEGFAQEYAAYLLTNPTTPLSLRSGSQGLTHC